MNAKPKAEKTPRGLPGPHTLEVRGELVLVRYNGLNYDVPGANLAEASRLYMTALLKPRLVLPSEIAHAAD